VPELNRATLVRQLLLERHVVPTGRRSASWPGCRRWRRWAARAVVSGRVRPAGVKDIQAWSGHPAHQAVRRADRTRYRRHRGAGRSAAGIRGGGRRGARRQGRGARL